MWKWTKEENCRLKFWTNRDRREAGGSDCLVWWQSKYKFCKIWVKAAMNEGKMYKRRGANNVNNIDNINNNDNDSLTGWYYDISKTPWQIPKQVPEDKDNRGSRWNCIGHTVHGLQCGVAHLLQKRLLEDQRRERDSADWEDLRHQSASKDHQLHEHGEGGLQDQQQGHQDWMETYLACSVDKAGTFRLTIRSLFGSWLLILQYLSIQPIYLQMLRWQSCLV